ncbi:MAG TPA: hypothetical protein VK324_10390, partial [Tepidisphaeraceae bacterium]|nr:hypothetical protein [Tepidisphaeraceae bacterium]
VYATLVRPRHPQVPAAFGQLLEVSWAGGHGSSAAMGKVYEGLEFPAGRDLAFFLATVGLIYGVTSGLVLVNVAVRRGWTAGGVRGAIPLVSGLEPRHDPPPTMFARTRTEVLDPLTLQAVVLLAAFGVGYGLQQAFVWLATHVIGLTDPDVLRGVNNVPLFLFTLLGGWAVRRAMQWLRCGDLIDRPSLHRLQGLAMDVLIVAAVTTMRVDALRSFVVPVVALIVLGGAWAAVCLLVIAPRLLPRAYWFELGLLNYGFSTANTPQGLMLLRIVDPELKTGAAEDYAVAAPLSAPFIGGGILTVAVFPIVLANVNPWVAVGVLLIAAIVLYVVGRRLSDAG